MPNFSYREICKKLRKKGFSFFRSAKGSHEIWINTKNIKIVIPKHKGNMPTGTVSQIIKRAGFKNINEFIKF